jgi:DNA-binding NarL/FixJ family response regulator
VYSNNLDSSLIISTEIYSPQVLVLDIDGSSSRGLEYAKKISSRFPDVRIIIMTYNLDRSIIAGINRTGAVACLDKDISEEGLITAVKDVSAGLFPINENVIERPGISENVLRQLQNDNYVSGRPVFFTDTPLTLRETEILGYVAGGNSNKQIAYTLQISEQTTKNHISNILRKLRANDRAHAVVTALRRGWITVEEEPLSAVAVTKK